MNPFRKKNNGRKIEDQAVTKMEDVKQDLENTEPVEEVQETTQETEQDIASQLETATALAEEYLNLAQRVQADFDNFRRRNESVRADSFAEGQRSVVAAMLPVLDNLERAVSVPAEGADALRSGVELTLRQMRDALQKMNVTEIDRLGEKFDPNLENAVLQGTSDEGEPGTVCMVLQKGYMMDKAVIRHAMVKVVAE